MNKYKFMTKEDEWDYLKLTYEYNVILDNVIITRVRCSFVSNKALFISSIVTEIGPEAFFDCAIEEMYIPDTIKKIGDYAFCNCENLRELYIGKNATFDKPITGIYKYNSYALTKVFRIVNTSSVKEINWKPLANYCLVYDEFDNLDHGIKTSDEGYKIALYRDICLLIEVPKDKIIGGFFELDKITYKGKELKNITMGRCNNLKHKCEACVINADVVEIDRTFEKGILKYISLPESLKIIRKMSFAECRDLLYIKMPKEMALIGAGAFQSAGNLPNYRIPNGIKTLYSFTVPKVYSETDIPSIYIPRSIREIDRYAFCGNVDEDNVNIFYDGTKEEWMKIRKDEYWADKDLPITCTDGIRIEKRSDRRDKN